MEVRENSKGSKVLPFGFVVTLCIGAH